MKVWKTNKKETPTEHTKSIRSKISNIENDAEWHEV